MPISPPSHACLRTKPVNRKFTPIVVTARKSLRTRSEAKPTTTRASAATAVALTSESGTLRVAIMIKAAA